MPEPINSTDVYILCGGLGRRLKSIAGDVPKPMVKVGRRPFLDILIGYMVSRGFRRFILGVGYKAEIFRKYYRNFPHERVKIEFCEERYPLGTGGAVKNAKNLIKSDPFLVLNGDSICEFDPADFLRFHKSKKAIVSMLLRKVPIGSDYGMVRLDRAGRIVSFNEKYGMAKNCLINAGVYIFNKEIFGLMPRRKAFSMERDIFPELPGKRCFGYKKSGFFIDIGTPKRYLEADKHFKCSALEGRA